ncbi:MAG: hypothetical protein AB7S44_03185 [Spirochaetales bacterium]
MNLLLEIFDTQWWENNLVLSIQAILSFLILIGAIITIILTNYNVKKQINNNNKQLNRPYLKIKSLNLCSNYELEDNIYNISIGTYNSKENTTTILLEIEFENLGVGLAHNFIMLDMQNNKDCLFFNSKIHNTGNVFSTIDIPVNGIFKQKIRFDLHKKLDDFNQVGSVVIFPTYSDINDNIYTAYLHVNCLSAEYTYYPENTASFKNMLFKRELKLDLIKKEYKERMIETRAGLDKES